MLSARAVGSSRAGPPHPHPPLESAPLPGASYLKPVSEGQAASGSTMGDGGAGETRAQCSSRSHVEKEALSPCDHVALLKFERRLCFLGWCICAGQSVITLVTWPGRTPVEGHGLVWHGEVLKPRPLGPLTSTHRAHAGLL